MIFIPVVVLTCGLLRLVAPHIKTLAAGRELTKPGMTFMEVGRATTPVDGVWAPEELPAVLAALQGHGDKRILAIGQERIEVLAKAGCPSCPSCRKLFPSSAPGRCDRCGHDLGDKN